MLDVESVAEAMGVQLPELPEGRVWGLVITADVDVIHPDGSVN